jgi:hypothetical protein
VLRLVSLSCVVLQRPWLQRPSPAVAAHLPRRQGSRGPRTILTVAAVLVVPAAVAAAVVAATRPTPSLPDSRHFVSSSRRVVYVSKCVRVDICEPQKHYRAFLSAGRSLVTADMAMSSCAP